MYEKTLFQAHAKLVRHKHTSQEGMTEPSPLPAPHRAAKTPIGSAPQPVSTTHQFVTPAGNAAYQGQAQQSTGPSQIQLASMAAGHKNNPVLLMVQQAWRTFQDVDPEHSLLARAGIRMPHPKPYTVQRTSKDSRCSPKAYCGGYW